MKSKILGLSFVFLASTLLSNPFNLIKKAGDANDYPSANYLVIYDSTSVNVQESGLS